MAILPRERSDRRIRILLTGFGRFPGAPTNPSASIVAAVAQSARRRLAHCGLEIITAVLPVEFDKIEPELANQLAAAKPDASLHLGLAGRRSVLTIETRAKNKITSLHPDAARRRSKRATIAIGGPDWRKTRLPVARLVAAMRETGAASQLSHDAGDYVCNAALYLSLGSAIPVAGFIHVPWPRRKDRPMSRRSGTSRPSHEAMVRAVTAALLLIGAQIRSHRALTERKTEAKSSG